MGVQTLLMNAHGVTLRAATQEGARRRCWRRGIGRAVIGLAYLSGTRRAELVALHLDDVDADPAAIPVVGKGGRQRLVPLSPTVGPLLEKWMELRGDSDGPLFCPVDRRGNLRLGHTLSGEAIRQILSRRTLAAGLAAISPHDLRRT